MAKVERKRIVRSVTLSESVVAYAKKVGKTLLPPRVNLSQMIDEALAQWAERNDSKKTLKKT